VTPKQLLVYLLYKHPPVFNGKQSVSSNRQHLSCGGLWRVTEKNCLMFDARRILTSVTESDCKRPSERPHTSWMATMKNDLSYHNLSVEDATELALDRPLWRLLAASGAMC